MRRAAPFALCAALLALTPLARADALSGADAQQLFERGKEAMSVGRFAEARDWFQRSLDLSPKASAAFNLAVALRGMGKPKEADDVLQELLAGKYGALPDDRRRQVEQLAGEARRDVATLVVEARGAPAIEVRVDGARIAEIAGGASLSVRVNPGERTLTLAAKGRDTLERTVVVAPGKSLRVREELALSRAARQASLVVVAENPSHEVEIVGLARARGRVERRLDPGTYRVRVISPGGSRTSSIEMEPATNQRIVLAAPQPSIIASPWFWAATGVAVAGIAVGTFFLARSKTQDPVTDPQYGLVTTSHGVLRF
jgi:hypothetical protein